jgi:Domain of unknown function (DUF4136)
MAASRTGVGMRACGRPLVAVVSSVVLVACSSLRVASDFDHAASFAGYHSFSWMVREHPGAANPLVVQRAHDAIEAELKTRGFSEMADPAAADFVVDFTIGSRERTEVNTYPAPYTSSGWWNGQAWWGYPYWGGEVDVRQYREGTLSIDVFDGHTHRPVWHGWARKELSRADIEHSEAPIRAAVAAVLAQFPPGPR